jgi:diguanylate cyclase (GGDEF)-like protein
MRLIVLLLLCLLPVGPAQAIEFELESLDQVTRLHGVWRFRPGDDMAWADPAYNHGQWGNILVPRDWRRQGHQDLTGFAWYRARVRIGDGATRDLDSLHQLGFGLGKVHSAYELYIGGELIGSAGRFPPDPLPVADRMRMFSIPPSALDDDGTLLIAVRVWRDDPLGDASTAGMFEGEFMMGPVFELTKQIWIRQAVTLMLAIAYLVFGIYHLYLYARNRNLPEFFWFGITACLVAIYSVELSQWKHVVGWMTEVPYIVHKKVEYGVVFLLPAVGLQLLACLLRIRVPFWARAYQAGFGVFALIVLVVPGYDVLALTLFPWQMYLVPGLFASLVLVVWHAARGNEEARTMTVGWAVFLFTALNDIMVAQGAVQNPRLLTVGFAAVMLTMAISLANRFSRMYNHLDGEVQQRTKELERSNEKLIEAARLDSLTGLLNRRGFSETGEAEIARAGRSGRAFVVLMGDIDRFKDCNDEYGHACGDYVLQEVAELFKGQLRDVDTVARWGGEEFVFLLPETEIEGGSTLAEKMRASLEHTLFSYEGSVLSLTITIGVAAYRNGMSLEDCVARADSAMYSGKQQGRNRVVIDGEATELASMGEAPGHA